MIILSIATALGATAVFVAPRLLEAGPPPAPETMVARVPLHQRQIEMLGRLISGCREVVAHHDRDVSPFLEIVLWAEDADDDERPDPSEIWVLSHSRIMETVTLYELVPGEGGPELSGLTDRSFCDRWRADDRVGTRVLLTGISDMRLAESVSPDGGSTRLRITLAWSAKTADGADEASVLILAAMPAGSSP